MLLRRIINGLVSVSLLVSALNKELKEYMATRPDNLHDEGWANEASDIIDRISYEEIF